MHVIYKIHSNFEHCNVNLDGEVFSYDTLLSMLDKSRKEYKKGQKLIRLKKRPNVEEFRFNYSHEKFSESNLSEKELKKLFYLKKTAKAKSWLGSLRRKKKSGKLPQAQVDILNDLGMLWNPTKDIWEKYYILFQSDTMEEILRFMKSKEWYISSKKLNNLIGLERWIMNQQFLFKSGTIPKENLKRLNYINFPFNADYKNNSLTIATLVELISKIRELRIEYSSYGIKSFAKKYKISEKVYVGTPIKIPEKLISSALKKEEAEYNAEQKKWEERQQRQEKNRKSNALTILKVKSNDYFIGEIDKAADINAFLTKRELSLSKKQIFFDEKNQKYSSFIEKVYSQYTKLESFLFDKFLFPRTRLNNVVYDSVYLNYEFNDEIKKYAANKMIILLDDYLLKSGIINYKKRFKPITYLMDIYKKENNMEGLLMLKKLIDNHEILNILYKQRLNKNLMRLKLK